MLVSLTGPVSDIPSPPLAMLNLIHSPFCVIIYCFHSRIHDTETGRHSQRTIYTLLKKLQTQFMHTTSVSFYTPAGSNADTSLLVSKYVFSRDKWTIWTLVPRSVVVSRRWSPTDPPGYSWHLCEFQVLQGSTGNYLEPN